MTSAGRFNERRRPSDRRQLQLEMEGVFSSPMEESNGGVLGVGVEQMRRLNTFTTMMMLGRVEGES